MPNKPLKPKVHFIVGLLISGFSAYTLLFVDIPNTAVMKLFLYIGLGFIALAFIKLGIKYIKSGKLKKDEKIIATKLSKIPQQSKNEEYQEQLKRQKELQQQSTNQNKPTIIPCRLCSTNNYSTSNFCHMCGYKLK